jgi:hypothetical protein
LGEIVYFFKASLAGVFSHAALGFGPYYSGEGAVNIF